MPSDKDSQIQELFHLWVHDREAPTLYFINRQWSIVYPTPILAYSKELDLTRLIGELTIGVFMETEPLSNQTGALRICMNLSQLKWQIIIMTSNERQDLNS